MRAGEPGEWRPIIDAHRIIGAQARCEGDRLGVKDTISHTRKLATGQWEVKLAFSERRWSTTVPHWFLIDSILVLALIGVCADRWPSPYEGFSVKDFYIPLEADATDVMVYSAAAYRDRPPAGQRTRTEMIGSIQAPEDDDPEDDELQGFRIGFEDGLNSTTDVAFDLTEEAVDVITQTRSGSILEYRFLVRDRLFYQRALFSDDLFPAEWRSDAPDEGAFSPTPTRWNQTVDMGMPIDLDKLEESYQHPERRFEQALDMLGSPQIKLEMGPDESLPRDEVGCLVIETVCDKETFLRLVPESMRLKGNELDAVQFPVTVSSLISRETGYLHRSETRVTFFVDSLGTIDLTTRMVYYNHGRPIHISAPPAAEVNQLLATQNVKVVEVHDRRTTVSFTGRNADGTETSFCLLDRLEADSGAADVPLPVVGERGFFRVEPSNEHLEMIFPASYRTDGLGGVSWRDEITDQELAALDERPVEIVEVEDPVFERVFVIAFPDDSRETLEIDYHDTLPALHVGERLKAYRRQMPDGPHLISLRRGDEIIWEEPEDEPDEDEPTDEDRAGDLAYA
jgi:hypothetical protein